MPGLRDLGAGGLPVSSCSGGEVSSWKCRVSRLGGGPMHVTSVPRNVGPPW